MIRALFIIACTAVFVYGANTDGIVIPCAMNCACFDAENGTSAKCDGWKSVETFGNLTAHLRSLLIRNVRMQELDFSRMFPGSDFSELRSLIVSNSEIVNVSNKSFRNLSIEHLKLFKITMTKFSEGTFFPLAKTLRTFEVNQVNLSRLNNKWFSGLLRLERLYISSANISEFDEGYFSQPTILRRLALSGNKLRNVNSSWFGNDVCHQLLFLDMSSNYISLLDKSAFQCFLSLEHLNLSNNHMSSISEACFQELKKLKTLDVSSNNISIVEDNTFHNLSQLQMLNISNNHLQVLRPGIFDGLVTLKTLDISFNRITELEGQTFSRLQSLVVLHVKNNLLTTLNGENFFGLSKLRTLNLAENRISEVATETFQYLIGLTDLQLGDNPLLGNLEQELIVVVGAGRRLTTLDASRSGLTFVPPALTHSIRTLRLSGNHISAIHCGDTDSYPLIQVLDLNNNLINEIEEDALGRLEFLLELYLSNNNITNIPCSLPSGLQVLYLNGNQITEISANELQELPNLQNISLANCHINNIQEGSFSQLLLLKFLDLSQNPLKQIQRSVLAGPSQLHVLKLANLQNLDINDSSELTFPVPSPEWIESLDLQGTPVLVNRMLSDTSALISLRQVWELNIECANLTTLRPDFFHFLPRLRILHLHGNLWNCEESSWFSDWIAQHQEVTITGHPTCSYQHNKSRDIQTRDSFVAVSTQSIYFTSKLAEKYNNLSNKEIELRILNKSVEKLSNNKEQNMFVKNAPQMVKAFNLSTLEIFHNENSIQKFKGPCYRNCTFRKIKDTYHNNTQTDITFNKNREHLVTESSTAKSIKSEKTGIEQIKIKILKEPQSTVYTKPFRELNISLVTTYSTDLLTQESNINIADSNIPVTKPQAINKIISQNSNTNRFSKSTETYEKDAAPTLESLFAFSKNISNRKSNITDKEIFSLEILTSESHVRNNTVESSNNLENIVTYKMNIYEDAAKLINVTQPIGVKITSINNSLPVTMPMKNTTASESNTALRKTTFPTFYTKRNNFSSSGNENVSNVIERPENMTEISLEHVTQSSGLKLQTSKKHITQLKIKEITGLTVGKHNILNKEAVILERNENVSDVKKGSLVTNFTSNKIQSHGNETDNSVFYSQVAYPPDNNSDNSEKSVFLQSHPGMFVLLAVVICMAGALAVAVSHCAKRRKRHSAVEYCRQQDIEVRSISSIGDIW